MTNTMRSTIKRLVPASIRDALREYRELPPTARACWRSALRQRLLTGRDITSLPAMLPDEPRILVLCYGNIYRSPYAAALLQLALSKRPGLRVEVRSAGLIKTQGRPCPADAQALASSRGLDLTPHVSHTVTPQEIAEADVILIMDRRNEALLRARYPHGEGKLVFLGAYDPMVALLGPTIPDPYGQGEDALEDCFDRLERSVARFADALGGRVPVGAKGRFRGLTRRAVTSAAIGPMWKKCTKHRAAILMLHRFEDRDSGSTGHSPELLRCQIEYLRRQRFMILPLEDLLARAIAGEPLPDRAISFTVDDGYSDFARIGMPIFAEFDVPVTLFVTTRFLDGDHWQWYDAVSFLCAAKNSLDFAPTDLPGMPPIRYTNARGRVSAVRVAVEALKEFSLERIWSYVALLEVSVNSQLPAAPPPRYSAIRWDELSTLGRLGAQFGAHTQRHVTLAREEEDVARREIVESVARIRTFTDYASGVFAYPNGLPRDFGKREERLVAEAKCIAAVASTGGHCTAGSIRSRPFAIPRVPYSDDLHGMRQSLLGLDIIRSLVRGAGPR